MRITRVLLCVVAAVWVLVAAACSSAAECHQKLRSAQTSPDGKLKAAILDASCGASGADKSWVLIADANAKFRDEEDKAAGFEGAVERISWRGDELLVIYGRAKPAKTPDSAKGIPINYLESEQPTDLGALR